MKYTFEIRLNDGRTIYETENPLTACREFFDLTGKKQKAYIVSPSRAASMYLYTTLRQNMTYIYVMAHKSNVEAVCCEQAVQMIVDAAKMQEFEPFVKIMGATA